MLPETQRLLAATGVLAAYLASSAVVLLRARRRRRQGSGSGRGGWAGANPDGPALLVAHASQTGFAEELAWRTAEALRAGGCTPVRVAGLGGLEAADLAAAREALFVISTTGEGDAPDSAARFLRRVMPGAPDLSGLRFGLLALGDSGYSRFCAFGRSLDAWLQGRGARPLFDRVEVDDGEEGALRRWEGHLGSLAHGAAMPGGLVREDDAWRLVERRLLNPGSPGGPVFHLALEPLGPLPRWCAGDIAEIRPRHPGTAVAEGLRRLGLEAGTAVEAPAGRRLGEVLRARALPREAGDWAALAGLSAQALVERLPPLPRRDYSIASLPEEGGRLELLVRQMREPDGAPGLGSGWLTAHAEIGAAVALRIRTNRGFHAPEGDRPLVLVGNGTGLAGLRAHLKARRAAGRRRNWLVFGERTRAHDLHHRAEIEAWLAEGTLQRLDLAFSRDDGDGRGYVQDRLRAAAPAVRDWVAAGAAILVCGSLRGMAPGVDAALVEILGAATVERLAGDGLYRRDVY
jgi:sulfite reductase (NADPH) flavoprotein alpha-component